MVRLLTFFKGVFSGAVLGVGMYFLFVATAEASALQPSVDCYGDGIAHCMDGG